MNHRRRTVSAMLAALVTGALPAGVAAQEKKKQAKARPEVRVPYLQYPLGGGWEGYIIFDRYVATSHPWVRPVQQETGGYVHNLKVMATDKNLQKTATFGSSTLAIYLAENAYKPFFDEPIKSDDWRHLYGATVELEDTGLLQYLTGPRGRPPWRYQAVTVPSPR